MHVHDIFLPFDYRRDWVLDEFRFWTEQYVLQAFLTFNSEFEVLLANAYLNHYHQQELKAAFPGFRPGREAASGCDESPIASLRVSQTEGDKSAPKEP